jgi:phosphate-selective porin OprO/OprP
VSIGASGFQFTSADTNFSLNLKGLVQTDHYLFVGDNPLSQGNDGFVLRRVRLAAQGTLGRNFEYLIVPQYGGYGAEPVQILDASISFKPAKSFEIRAGKFKGPVGLELLQSINHLPFNERSMVSGLVPQRSIGVQASGSLWDGLVSGSAGVFNSAGDLRNPQNFDFTDDREFAGRLFFRPFQGTDLKPVKGLGFGLGGSYSQISSNALGLPSAVGGSESGYTTSPGVQQFFAYNPLAGPVVADGAHWRLSPQGSWYWGPFGLLGEYVVSSQGVYNSSTFRSARLAHSGWQVTADWVLTGESASFGGVTPKNPFQWGSPGWGAWQLVGRFSQFDVDKDAFPAFANPDYSASGADAWSVGINWWLNRNARILTSFTHTSFTGGGAPPNLAAPASLLTPAIVTAQDENVVASRIQISF